MSIVRRHEPTSPMTLQIFGFHSQPSAFAVTKANFPLQDCVFLLDFSRPLERHRWFGVHNKWIGVTVALLVPVVHQAEKSGGYLFGMQRGDPYFLDIQQLWRRHRGARRTIVAPHVDPSRIIGDFATHFPEDCGGSQKSAHSAGAQPIRNRSGKKWTLLPERIGAGTLLLIGNKRKVEIEESVFCFVLVAGKINAWSGGDGLFETIEGREVLLPLQDGLSIENEDAVELGVQYYDFIKKNSDGGDRGEFDENFLRLCAEGGFYIKRK